MNNQDKQLSSSWYSRFKLAHNTKESGIRGGFLNKMNPFSKNIDKMIEDISSQAAGLANQLMNYDVNEVLPSSLMPVSHTNTSIKEAEQTAGLKSLIDSISGFRDSLTQAKYYLQGTPMMSIIDGFLGRTIDYYQILSDPSDNSGFMSLANAMEELSYNIRG